MAEVGCKKMNDNTWTNVFINSYHFYHTQKEAVFQPFLVSVMAAAMTQGAH